MYWPDTGTGVDTEPARKPVASAVRKYFTEGGAGVPPTVPGGDWFNAITNEVLNVLDAAGIDPSKTDDDQLLLAIQRISKAMSAREALRRTYAEAGFNLVPGSFELGGTVTTATDVLLYEADGHGYNWDGVFPVGGKVVPQNSTPATTGGVGPDLWLDQADATLRGQLAEDGGTDLIRYGSKVLTEALDGIFEKPNPSLLTIGGMSESQKLGFDLNGAVWTKDLLQRMPADFRDGEGYCLTSGVFDGIKIITVGVTGDFQTLNEAVQFASLFRPKYRNYQDRRHNRIEIKILSGTEITEGLIFRAIDMSYVLLTSDDPVVPVNFNNNLWWMYGEWQAKLPTIATIFDMQGIGFDGVSAKMGSQIMIEYNQDRLCGVINAARHNLFANTACNVVARGGVFTGAAETAIHLEKGCTGSARSADCSGSNTAIQLIESSLDIYGVNGRNSRSYAILSQNGSSACGFGVDLRDSFAGVRADNASKIGIPGSNLTGIGATYAISIADEMSEVDLTGSTLTGGAAAALAIGGGRIALGPMDLSGTGGALSNMRVLNGGFIFATGSTGTTSITPNTLQPNGIIFK
ncbi:hypothetical protein [Aeromonas salmonicida]|uniref:tail fiber/spike domain-containing protein n=1 Tax=Aeromonas salmonicida TaxID=645 RepID=UPI003D23BB4D